MFNSAILDVALGMIFVYLLLSLICSAANEAIELLWKKRATDLERGLRELLEPDSLSGEDGVVRKLYDHPLINGLFDGSYLKSGIASRWRYLKGTDLPSYIPARNFALALMDTVLPGQAAGAAGAVPPGAAGVAGGAGTVSSGAAGATVSTPTSPPAVAINVQAASAGAPAIVAVPPAAAPAGPNPLLALRNQVHTIGNKQVEQALIALIDAAGNDVTRARENIENWFNSSMDRVSGWYKRRSQVILLVLGFLMAIAFNADSIIIAKKLSSDRALRESVVAAAEAYAKKNAEASPNPTPAQPPTKALAPNTTTPGAVSAPASTPTPTATPTPLQSPTPASALSTATPAATLPAATSTPTPISAPTAPDGSASASPSPARCWDDECKDGAETPQCKLKKAQCQIEELGLPIGWPVNDKGEPTWPGLHFWYPNEFVSRWYPAIRLHFLGWLLTALAVSLGAPFWFDLLNKFIVVRGTVKPKEKSPEEKSKS